MKKIFILFISVLFAGIGASAQQSAPFKRIESNVILGGGLFLETGTDYRIESQNPGLALRLSYGLDIRFNERWSVMPGIGVRSLFGGIMHGQDGVDNDKLYMGDVFLAGRYRLGLGRRRAVLGLGPAFSYILSPVYYGFSNVSIEKYRRFDVGIQPSVTFFSGDNFLWGLEANVGLRDLRLRYPFINTPFSPTYLHYLAVTCGWRF